LVAHQVSWVVVAVVPDRTVVVEQVGRPSEEMALQRLTVLAVPQQPTKHQAVVVVRELDWVATALVVLFM
jgi:hypothetical protein